MELGVSTASNTTEPITLFPNLNLPPPQPHPIHSRQRRPRLAYPDPRKNPMPVSQRRIDAARANGAKSKGPRTPAGKAASALNAVTHGLSARTVVLANESQEQYQAELDQYLAHFQPKGKPECDLVHQLAAVHWRLCRYAAVESRILEYQMDRDRDWFDERELPEDHRLAIAFHHQCGANSALALLNRYDARLHREYRETLKLLEKMQAAREARQSKLQNKPKPAEPSAIATDAGLPWVIKPTSPSPPVQPAAQAEIKTSCTSSLQPLEFDLPSPCENGSP
jgi:hypothetical protein